MERMKQKKKKKVLIGCNSVKGNLQIPETVLNSSNIVGTKRQDKQKRDMTSRQKKGQKKGTKGVYMTPLSFVPFVLKIRRVFLIQSLYSYSICLCIPSFEKNAGHIIDWARVFAKSFSKNGNWTQCEQLASKTQGMIQPTLARGICYA